MDLEQYSRDRLPFAMRMGRKLRWPINRFLTRQSLIGTRPFFDSSEVPGLEVLHANWETIREEAQTVMADRENVPPLGKVSPDHRGIASTSAWKSFFFSGYGYHAPANRALCPKTAALVDQVPNVVVAFYSIFEPGTYVPRHKGVTSGLINVHLPLIVPPAEAGRCEIRVDDQFRRWAPGEYLIFDETYEHEVWNDTNEPRVVLLLQVLRPMRWRGRLLGKLFLWCVKHTSFVQDVRKALAVS